MGLTGLFGKVDRRTAIKTIHHALDCGVRHFDTAELYGPYVNEELLAEALTSSVPQPVIATKVGYRLVDGKIAGIDGHPASLRRAVEGSLHRLRRDRIDLVYQHRQDPAIPVEEAIGALTELQSEGKIGDIGLSTVDGPTLARARTTTFIACVQNEYSILNRKSEQDALQEAKQAGIAFVAYSPLARGILSGCARNWMELSEDDYRKSDRRFSPDQLEGINRSLAPLHEIAANHGTIPSAVALAWLNSRAENIAVIPGCKSPAQMSAAVEAMQLKLSADEVVQLEAMTYGVHAN
jgi:aryl-alcohol dehydrogenase-like predicted oxidoreductase